MLLPPLMSATPSRRDRPIKPDCDISSEDKTSEGGALSAAVLPSYSPGTQVVNIIAVPAKDLSYLEYSR